MFSESFSIVLKNKDICEFTCDHATLQILSELKEEDPLKYLKNGFDNFDLNFLWSISWCFSYWYRKQSGRNYEYLEFLAQLPVGDSILELRDKLSVLVVSSMPTGKKNTEQLEQKQDSDSKSDTSHV